MITVRKTTKKVQQRINPAAKPSGTGCAECLTTGGWWLHLRRCAECGHIGCCDSSPHQHAAQHAALTGHSIVQSFEPLQNWFYDYDQQKIVKGMRLLPPHSHPATQPVPGPEGRVPAHWESLLHGMEETESERDGSHSSLRDLEGNGVSQSASAAG